MANDLSAESECLRRSQVIVFSYNNLGDILGA
jgi:hypothetical protein